MLKDLLGLRLNNAKSITIVIDMYTLYISLIKTMFSNFLIVIDKFYLIELFLKALNKTKIKLMKKKENYNKFKRYWKIY